LPGRKLSDGRYELASKIGHGGMGEVWLGRDVRLEREIAVKFLRVSGGKPDEEHIRRFVRESRITARLRHPGVPVVYDGGLDENGWPFLVMERVRGISVADLISEQGPLPVGWTAAIAAQVCAVLDAAHNAKLVHRDLKPSNLMLEPDGCVKVLDFGLATAPTLDEFSRITMTNQPLGSPPYMAPEQVEGAPALPATDLYALGCTMHEMLTAEQVFSGSTYISVMLQQVKDSPPAVRTVRSDVPAELEELILTLLSKKPEDRPATAEEAYRRLLPFVTDLAPLIGALDPPAKTSPARLYAGVLNRIFPGVTEKIPSEPESSPPKAVPSPTRQPPIITREDLAKARGEARRMAQAAQVREAVKALQRVEALARQAFGSTDADVVRVRYDLATTLFEGGEHRRAAPLFDALAQDLANVEGAADLLFDCRLKEATCAALAGRLGDALQQLKTLLAERRASHGDDDPRSLDLRKQIGLLQLGAQQPVAAKRTLIDLLADLRALPTSGGPDLEEVARLLGSIPADDIDAGPVDDAWRSVLRYANHDEPGLSNLLTDLAGRGLPAPVVGFELGDEAWPAELAWPQARIAVLPAGEPDDPETTGRIAAYAAADWDARTAGAWSADELTERITA
jgi:serine/threonine protein kinase